MSAASGDPTRLLRRALESGRVHTGYIFSGDAEAALAAAETFARALVCDQGGPSAPCDSCPSCMLSAGSNASDEPIEIDSNRKRGPFFRHLGDHPDLYWIDRGRDSTRVRINQVRALQIKLQLGPSNGGRAVAIIAEAEWLSEGAENALLRLLEEPPGNTTLVLVTPTAAGLRATIRSRCQRVVFPLPRDTELRGPDVDEEIVETVSRLDRLDEQLVPELLEWAEEFRGDRARAAEKVQRMLATSVAWLRERTTAAAREGDFHSRNALDAFQELQRCRKDLNRRNANPQMVAERAIFALHTAARSH